MSILRNEALPGKFALIIGASVLIGFCIITGSSISAGTKSAPQNIRVKPLSINKSSSNAVLAVGTSRVEMSSMRHKIALTGSISARDDLSIGPKTSGLQIKQVLVEEGDSVKQNQVLAVLDNEVLKAQLAQEEAQLASVQASYQKSLQPNALEEIVQQEFAVRSAQAAVERNSFDVKKAESEYRNAAAIAKRYSDLHKEGGSSDEEFEQKATNAETAFASLNSAKQSQDEANQTARQAQEKLHQLRRGGRIEDIRIAKASVAQHVARIQELRADLDQTFVRSSADGLITERGAHIGDISSSTKILFKITRSSELEMTGNLSQDDLTLVHVGQEAEITNGTNSVTGHVWLVSPTVDSQSRLGKIHIQIPTGKGFLQGMFVSASMLGDVKRTLTVPESAIQSDSDHLFTYRVSSGVCHKTWVKTGNRSDGLVEIVSGLSEGDNVVTDGVSLVNDKDNVRISKALSEVLK